MNTGLKAEIKGFCSLYPSFPYRLILDFLMLRGESEIAAGYIEQAKASTKREMLKYIEVWNVSM